MEKIPIRLEGFAKFLSEVKSIASSMGKGIDEWFVKYGLSFVPSQLRYGAVIGVVCMPFFCLIYITFYFDDEEVPVPEQP